jgi:nitroreductase
MDNPNVQEQLGYTGEGVILEATALKLGTCWVGGFFRPGVAANPAGISENERVIAITPVGYTSEAATLEEKTLTGFGRNHRRKKLSSLVSGLPEAEWPDWVQSALQAARLAPSAVNRQPWRFHVENDGITILADNLTPGFNVSKRLDCGIAMLHIEVAALNSSIRGKWDFLETPAVARFQAQG